MSRTTALIACLASGTFLPLGGCVVGPDYVRPQTKLSAAYRESHGEPPKDAVAADEIRWWRRFDDAHLSALVEKAIAANNGVEVAAARLREARAARRIVQSQLSPQVGLGASALRARTSEAGLGIPGELIDIEHNLFQVGFDASWALDVFGGVRRQIESAEAAEQAADSDRRGVVLMIAAETAKAVPNPFVATAPPNPGPSAIPR